MRIPKLQVLAEAGVVRDVAARHQSEPAGWTVHVTYASRTGERRDVLERQRGTTWPSVARCRSEGAGRWSRPPADRRGSGGV